ncbi:hypothetical protein [Aquabacterium humicola]|uniref:hypothetical protein n=1 Tax=Aquabacterium humicola TaxID=3237377 RepID=UPI002543C37B|nr:hypothetical protein [Rubrivivax pictus]
MTIADAAPAASTTTTGAAGVSQLSLPAPNQVHAGRNFPAALADAPPPITKPEGFVEKGSLVSFVAGVSPQNRDDVLNSTLLAQLAADKQCDREADAMNWYKAYTTVLGKVGWTIEGANFSVYSSSSASFTMDKAVLEIAGAALTGDEAAVVAATIDALGKLPTNDGRLQLFDHSASNGKEGNFQICVCTETNGAVAMKTMAFWFTSDQSSTTVLFFNYSSAATTLKKSVQGATLNSAVYASVRNAVLDKLGQNAQQFVLDLDI